MTGQIPDDLRHLGKRYAITAVEGEGLFDPAAHGLAVQWLSTACWRGSLCAYEVREDHLTLTGVRLGQPDDAGPPAELYGVSPARAGRRDIHPGALLYEGLDARMPFTGRLLIGIGSAPGAPMINMGFQPAWVYARVRELHFTAGRLTADHDRTEELAVVREHLGPTAGRPAAGESSADWIDRTFSRDFSYSWPTVGR